MSADEHAAASGDDGIPAHERADQRNRPRIARWIADQGPGRETSSEEEAMEGEFLLFCLTNLVLINKTIFLLNARRQRMEENGHRRGDTKGGIIDFGKDWAEEEGNGR